MPVRNFVAVLFLSVLLVGPFGIPRFGIDTLPNGQTTPCPFMHGGSVCTMTPLEHAGATHSMFNILPSSRDSFFALLFLLASAVAVILLVQKGFPPLAQFVVRIFVSPYTYTPSYRPLEEAFSNGLIHSRAF